MTIRMHLGPLPVHWTLEHRDYVGGRRFRDVQVSGPFRSWEHTHEVHPAAGDAAILEDTIRYELPLGAAGRAVGQSMAQRRLVHLFAHRHAVTRHDVEMHARHAKGETMRILISGATGLVGSSLVPLLTTGGHEVLRLRRSSSSAGPSAVAWDPRVGLTDPSSVGSFDAVVHLAGESIASGRWTAARKELIRASRVEGTRRLCESMAELPRPPATLVCASAIGYYGNRGEEELDESADPGPGFLANVCRAWEAATEPAVKAGIRVVHVRFGVVLSPRGGALAKMLTPFRLGAGGVMGSGRQYMSWVGIDDAVRAIQHCLITANLSGPVNVVSPSPVTNAEFTRTLGRVLRRPTILPMPAFAARLAFGEMADELLLASTRAIPQRLIETGFRFQDVALEDCLRRLLGAA